MSAQRFVVTQHAIDRYLARVDPTALRDDILATIEAESQSACALRERTSSGEHYFRTASFVLIAKRDRGRRAWLVVTLLSCAMFDRHHDDDDEPDAA